MSAAAPTTTGYTYRAAFLRLASELEALAGGLDTSSEECCSCGANRFKAYDEELAARKLLGWADSLNNLANAATGRKSGPPPAYLDRPAPPHACGDCSAED